MKLSSFNDAVSHPDFDKLLNLFEKRLEKQYDCNQDDINIIRQLANIYRQKGKLKKAQKMYKLAARHPYHGLSDSYSAQLFNKEKVSKNSWTSCVPSPFIMKDNFLKKEELAIIWSLIERSKEKFKDSKVRITKNKADISKKARVSKVIYKKNLKEISSFFLSKVDKTIRVNFSRLGIFPIEFGEKEVQLTLHNDGHFFTIHKDVNLSKTYPRIVTYVYYFHHVPKSYKGGDLLLYDTNKEKDIYSTNFTRIATRNNRLLLFPSYCYHQVTPIQQKEEDFRMGRFTINGWYHNK